MSAKVSVIIPVYNSEKYIGECLDSIINQTLRDIEIICVNDGSTDGTAAILEDYSKKDDRVIIIDQKNLGAGAARNNGLRKATGEYLSFLDADDFFEKDMLEKSYNAAKKKDADVVVFECDLYSNSEKKYRPCYYSIHSMLLPDHQPFAGVDIEKDIFKAFVGWAWDKLFKTSFVRENNLTFQEQRTTNDMLFVFSAVVKAESIVIVNKVLAHHRRDEGSLSVTREKSWMCFYYALGALKKQLIEWNLFERFKQDYINYCVHFSLWNLNSLAEPTHTLLLNKLKDEWYDEWEVTAHAKSYFYNKYEYGEYRMVCKGIDPSKYKENIITRSIRSLKENGIKKTIRKILH